MSEDVVINVPSYMRPRNFTDVIGQPFVQGLGRKIGKGVVSGQGYILSGPKGCGKTTTARIIAKSLNCERRDKSTGNPCGKCKQCLSIDNNTNPLVREVNAALNRGIGDIKEMLQSIKTGVRSGYLVIIFDEAHQLTKEAFSALLKPIEEPKENIIFIFTTTNFDAIPDTIKSRLTLIPIIPLKDADLREVVCNTIQRGVEEGNDDWSDITEKDIDDAVSMASGSPRQAITNVSGIVFHGVSQNAAMGDITDVVEGFIQGDVVKVLSEVTHVMEEWESVDPSYFVSQIINSLLDIMKQDKVIHPLSCAQSLASLAVLNSELSSSIQHNILASRIASCVHPFDNTEKDKPIKHNKEIKKSQKTAQVSKGNNRMNTPRDDVKSNTPQAPTTVINKVRVTATSDLDDVIAYILNNDIYQDFIPDEVYEVLDSEELSSISFDNGNLLVEIAEGDPKEFKSTLSNLIENVKVVHRNNVWDVY